MRKTIFLVLISFVSFFNLAKAQTEGPTPELISPYNTIYTHLWYLQPDTYQPEIAAMVIHPGGDSLKRVNQSIKLKQILDGKGLYVHLNQLPTDSNWLDTLSNKHYYTLFPKELPQVYLEKIDGKWYYSKESVNAIKALHKSVYPFGTDLLLNLFPGSTGKKVLGLAPWQYLAILSLLLVGIILFMVLKWMIEILIGIISTRRLKYLSLEKKLQGQLARLFSLVFVFSLIRLFLPALQLPILQSEWAFTGIKILMSIFVMLIFLRLVDILTHYLDLFAEKTESKMDDQLIPLVERGLQLIVVLFAIIQILRLLNVNVTALIAGISIGGLALALAAQDTVKNLLGSFMIFFDKPFQVGDWVSGSGFEGTITEVGFRSTRIQTVDSSIISVPNGVLANLSVENKGIRVFRLLRMNIGVTYDTPIELAQTFIDGLRQVALNHQKVRSEGYYIYMNQFENSSLNILFRVQLDTQDYNEELMLREEIIFKIIELAESLGIRFAFPSSTIYIEQFPEKKTDVPDYVEELSGKEVKLKAFLDKYYEKKEKE